MFVVPASEGVAICEVAPSASWSLAAVARAPTHAVERLGEALKASCGSSIEAHRAAGRAFGVPPILDLSLRRANTRGQRRFVYGNTLSAGPLPFLALRTAGPSLRP